MSSPSLPAPKLPVSMAPSLAPSVTESVPPSADVSAFPSAAASPTRTKRRPEQPESSASAKPGPISVAGTLSYKNIFPNQLQREGRVLL